MLVEHHMDLVMTVCDDITVLDFGKVIATGSPNRCATTRRSSRPTWAKRSTSRAHHLGTERVVRRGRARCATSASPRPQGQVTAVLGANGAGKTTLLRTISGLVRADAGSVRFGDHELTRTAARADAAAGHGARARGPRRDHRAERRGEPPSRRPRAAPTASGRSGLERVFALFPVLEERRRSTAHTLSGGERQMLVIGRALMASPTLLLLDEPSLGLAPRVVAQIFDLLGGLVADEGLTVVLVEQNARSALSIAHRAVVLNLGRVVVDDAADVLAGDDQLRHAYLGF